MVPVQLPKVHLAYRPVAWLNAPSIQNGAPVSAYVKYDPALFKLRRWTKTASTLDEFLVGVSVLSAGPSAWTAIEAATVSINYSYTPDANGTLIVEADTANISLSFWDEPGPLLYPGDRIDALYGTEVLFWGTVDSTQLSYATDPEAARHGASQRVDFSATAAGQYAVMMGRTVKWAKLPRDEAAIVRIRRWVTVNGWS